MWMIVGAALAAEVDWDAAGAEAAQVLADYLRVDTVNPPGNEAAGAAFLAGVLAQAGIPSETVDHGGGRASLIARLDGADTAPPLCLLSHLDVVPSEIARWDPAHPPLGGVVADGYVWGRGALDMKGMGVLETMTLIWLKRQAVPLARDVVLLAVADEEVGSIGMRALVDRWSEIGCSQVVNEGGLGLKDVFFEGQTVYGISVAEKGLLWARMIATGPAGHGSRPDPRSAPAVLTRAAARIEAWKHRPQVDPVIYDLFDAVGSGRKGIERMVLRSRLLARALVVPKLMAESGTRAALTDTVNITGFGGGASTNVVPTEAWASLDCRLLPGTTPAEMLARIEAVVDDPAVRFEVTHTAEANFSPAADSLFEALARHAIAGRPDAVAGPLLSVGFTDSLYLRPLGVHAYGFVPFAIDLDEAGTMHGHNERVSVQNVRDGLEILYGAIAEVVRAP